MFLYLAEKNSNRLTSVSTGNSDGKTFSVEISDITLLLRTCAPILWTHKTSYAVYFAIVARSYYYIAYCDTTCSALWDEEAFKSDVPLDSNFGEKKRDERRSDPQGWTTVIE